MHIKAFAAEFIGTLALIFVGMAVMSNGGDLPLIDVAFAHGLTIAVMASATGAVSGGHLNPAVTLALLVARQIPLGRAIGYIIAQCLGAVAGAYLALGALSRNLVETGKFGIPAPAVPIGNAILLEAIITFFLVVVVFGTAVDHRSPKLGALFIGLTVTLGIFAIGPLTGAALNPARWLGPAVVSGDLQNIVIYTVGPLVGGVLGAMFYMTFLWERPETDYAAATHL